MIDSTAFSGMRGKIWTANVMKMLVNSHGVGMEFTENISCILADGSYYDTDLFGLNHVKNLAVEWFWVQLFIKIQSCVHSDMIASTIMHQNGLWQDTDFQQPYKQPKLFWLTWETICLDFRRTQTNAHVSINKMNKLIVSQTL